MFKLFKKLLSPRRRKKQGDPLQEEMLREFGVVEQPDQIVSPATVMQLRSSGVADFRAGRYDDAVRQFEEVVALRPSDAQNHLNLGLAYQKLGRQVDAADCFELALAFKPEFPEAHFNLGVLAIESGAYAEAATRLQHALTLRPDYPAALSNLGYVEFRHLDRLADGELHLKRALALDPAFIDAHCNLGALFQEQGRVIEAFAEYEHALKDNPDCHEARLNQALILLAQGEFEEGWQLYEARKLCSPHFNPRNYPFPEWDGRAPGTVLVYGEQGLGDEIMFASCISDLIAAGRHCVIDCTPKLERLFRRSFPGADVHAGPQTATDLGWLKHVPQVDFQVAMGSLPALYRRTRDAFPQQAGYLTADSQRVAYWRDRLGQLGPGLKIGISWRGGTVHTRSRLRSIPLAEWVPLISCVAQSHWVSLQYTDCADERASFELEHGLRLHHWQQAMDDYDETAALVSALDLVISVQTAVVHLTGALGKPVWVLISAVPEWRYMAQGETLPWYPTARLFRQQDQGDWHLVMEKVVKELGALGHCRGRS